MSENIKHIKKRKITLLDNEAADGKSTKSLSWKKSNEPRSNRRDNSESPKKSYSIDSEVRTNPTWLN